MPGEGIARASSCESESVVFVLSRLVGAMRWEDEEDADGLLLSVGAQRVLRMFARPFHFHCF